MAPNDDVDSATAPANKLYNYEIRVLGIDRVLHSEPVAIDSPYDVGDSVWVKPPEARCHTKYKLGTVTKVISEQTIEVDGMPRHVRDLRSAVPPETAPTRAQIFISDDEELPLLPVRREAEEGSSDSDGEVNRPMPRAKRPGEAIHGIATDFNDYDVLIIRGECSEGWTKQGYCYAVDTCKRSRSIGAMNFM